MNDPLEREADAIADQVMRAPSPTSDMGSSADTRVSEIELDETEEEETLQRACSTCAGEDEQLRRTSATSLAEDTRIEREAGASQDGGSVNDDFSSDLRDRIRSGGRPLPASARDFLEPRLGVNLGDVRTHSDTAAGSLARRINARAFTLGKEIFFAPGELRPSIDGGMRLLAHEVAHTLQNTSHGGDLRSAAPDTNTKPSKQVLQRSPGPDVAHDEYMDPGELDIDTREGMEAFYIERITAYKTLHEAFWDRTLTQWEKDGEFDLNKNPELVEEIKSAAFELRDGFYAQWEAFTVSEEASEDAEAKFITQLDEMWVQWNAENLREWTEAKEILMNLPATDKGKSSYAWYLDKIKQKTDFATKYGGRFPEKAKKAIEQANKMKASLSPERGEDISQANFNIAIANFNLSQLLKQPIDEFLEVFLQMKETERQVVEARSASASVGFDFTLRYRTVNSRARHKDKFLRSMLTETVQKHVTAKLEGEEGLEPVNMAKERRLSKFDDPKRKKPNITSAKVADYFKKKFIEPMLVNKDAGELHAMLEELASKYPDLFPDYLVYLMEDFAGLTYQSGQNQWRDPVALVQEIIKNQLMRTEGVEDLAKTKKLEKIVKRANNFSAGEALAFLVKMRKRGQIPEFCRRRSDSAAR